jgi:hypothetical protein
MQTKFMVFITRQMLLRWQNENKMGEMCSTYGVSVSKNLQLYNLRGDHNILVLSEMAKT